MQQLLQSTLGMKISFEMPDSFDAINKAANDPSAALELALSQIMYHYTLPLFKGKFFEHLSATTDVVRHPAVKADEANGTEAVAKETDKSYWKRVVSDSGLTIEKLQVLGQEVASDMDFTLAKTGRSRKPGKFFMDKAEAIAGQVDAGGGTWEGVKAKIEGNNPGLTLDLGDDGAPEIVDLARAIEIDVERITADSSLL